MRIGRTARIGDRNAKNSLHDILKDGVNSCENCRKVSEGHQNHLPILWSIQSLGCNTTTTVVRKEASGKESLLTVMAQKRGLRLISVVDWSSVISFFSSRFDFWCEGGWFLG
jgi:hypothetical protein